MMTADEFAQYQEQERLRQEQEQQRIEDERRRQEEARRRAAGQQNTAAGGIDPGQALSMYSSFAGGSSPAAGGIMAGGGEAGGASAAGGASSASGGMSFWPLAVAAGVIAQHNWARKKGLHDNQDAILGRALYKDADYYQEKGNEKIDGLGDEMKLASLGSSPADYFRKDTWTTAAKLAAQGGILGKVLKKIF